MNVFGYFMGFRVLFVSRLCLVVSSRTVMQWHDTGECLRYIQCIVIVFTYYNVVYLYRAAACVAADAM